MNLTISCDLSFEIYVPTPFILMLRPRNDEGQKLMQDSFLISPSTSFTEYVDNFGNTCQRLIALPGNFSIHTSSELIVKDEVEKCSGAPFIEIDNLPDATLQFLMPSRYCESDRLNNLASSIVSNCNPGYDQIVAIENWMRDTIKYLPGSSDFAISAVEVLDKQFGVCRDFAHLGIALCRSISIPARIVVGYLYNLTPMDMHAWFEAYIGDKWYAFDAVHNSTEGGYVVVGIGRDVGDVAMYNQFGPTVFPTVQRIQVKKGFTNL